MLLMDIRQVSTDGGSARCNGRKFVLYGTDTKKTHVHEHP